MFYEFATRKDSCGSEGNDPVNGIDPDGGWMYFNNNASKKRYIHNTILNQQDRFGYSSLAAYIYGDIAYWSIENQMNALIESLFREPMDVTGYDNNVNDPLGINDMSVNSAWDTDATAWIGDLVMSGVGSTALFNSYIRSNGLEGEIEKDGYRYDVESGYFYREDGAKLSSGGGALWVEGFEAVKSNSTYSGLGKSSNGMEYQPYWRKVNFSLSFTLNQGYKNYRYDYKEVAQGGGDPWATAAQGGLMVGELTRQGKAYQFFGSSAQASDEALAAGKYIHNGDVYWQGNYRGVTNSMKNSLSTAKFVKATGRTLGVLGAGVTLYQAGSDFSDGRYKSGSARIAVGAFAAGAVFIPVVGWGFSIGIGVADAIWGDGFYDWLEN